MTTTEIAPVEPQYLETDYQTPPVHKSRSLPALLLIALMAAVVLILVFFEGLGF